MNLLKGEDRGSYIFGKSIHNIRIERLWRDITLGFGAKWKIFFQYLEQHDGLDATHPHHIWLLHHLFLGMINSDAIVWAESWNRHPLSLRRQASQTPVELFVFGMMENGIRGMDQILQVDDDDRTNLTSAADIDAYGIDWEDIEDSGLREHHRETNLADSEDAWNAFLTHRPEHFSHVEVTSGECPFTVEEVSRLDSHLHSLQILSLHDMSSRRLVWLEAVAFCANLVSNEP
ncbi:hypothetical protein CYLTODRAFT_362264 [Cylindrobasidium torrendii FP15055 ss-10]|uniref:Integrase core domain-containing protein n=1 Tax=Cylindrobasidium torrendii FP15055 ss-10 TaxID=1314674 RepID=A0A0D7AX57_9AGAR|nr:hypothetical protein CYLTODRAFT_362264 [Cylindrobasidium torrendii FP15055 ss-10]